MFNTEKVSLAKKSFEKTFSTMAMSSASLHTQEATEAGIEMKVAVRKAA